MLWPILTFITLAALIALHLRWQSRAKAQGEAAAREINALKEQQRTTELQAQLRQEALFDSMLEGVLVLDESGRIQLANRACTHLFSLRDDPRSKTLLEALRLHQLEHLLHTLQSQKQVLGVQLTLPGPPERTLEVNAAAISNPDTPRSGSILVFHDLTRIKSLERTREEFVASVSHELRTPLSLIKGYAETLLNGASADPEAAQKFTAIIDRNADRLRILIDDLLTISELESGRIKLNLDPTPLDSLIHKSIADHQAAATAKNVTLAARPSGLTVTADAGRVEQVLGNLLTNAIKYGREQGKVTIQAREAAHGFAEVTVRDDGPGIPEESLNRVFERFYRVDKARSREQGGTGLGLSIVKHIVQSHGGKVWVESRLGDGATFYFTLPLARA